MNLFEPHATTTPLTPFREGLVLSRGLTEQELRDVSEGKPLGPTTPVINGPSLKKDWLRLVQELPRLGVGHILGRPIEGWREIARSFSCQKRTADCYACSERGKPYSKAGVVAQIKIPQIVDTLRWPGSGPPVIYECEDGTMWLDGRHLPWGGIANVCVFCSHESQSRSRVDDEILLIAGSIQPMELLNVEPATCDQSYRPWTEILKHLGQERRCTCEYDEERRSRDLLLAHLC